MKKNIIKMILDIVMIVVLAMLYNSHVASMSFHEIAGLGIFGLFIIHCLLNVKWITSVSKRFFSTSLSPKVRLGYIVNLLLAITFIFAIISGIQTSQVLFPADSHGSIWRGIHHFCGAVSIILVGIHLGLHWTFISNMVKKIIPLKDVARKSISITLLIAVLAFGFYSIATSSFRSWLVEPFTTQTKAGMTEQSSEKVDDGKVDGDTSVHTERQGENKSLPTNEIENTTSNNESELKHNDSTKTVETSPSIILGTIARFISIMGIFSALTYYIEKFLKYRKRAKQ